jgi:hypothetical protein
MNEDPRLFDLKTRVYLTLGSTSGTVPGRTSLSTSGRRSVYFREQDVVQLRVAPSLENQAKLDKFPQWGPSHFQTGA